MFFGKGSIYVCKININCYNVLRVFIGKVKWKESILNGFEIVFLKRC